MQLVHSQHGAAISYDRSGRGPLLVLVHGAFSDHDTNWELVRPLLESHFTLCRIARRGRGATPATTGHSIDDEACDVVAVLRALGEPAFLLGHSYGAHVALAAASQAPDNVRKLVLYEPPWPHILHPAVMARLEKLAPDWDAFATTFFQEVLAVPNSELEALRPTPMWPPILADAPATLHDLRSLARYDFRPEQFRELRVPTVLQTGTQSPRELYATDALAAALPDAALQELPGQAHEGMTTAPELYAEAVTSALLR